MVTITLTDEEATVLENYLGAGNHYEQGTILCKAYDTSEAIEAAASHLLKIYAKLAGKA